MNPIEQAYEYCQDLKMRGLTITRNDELRIQDEIDRYYLQLRQETVERFGEQGICQLEIAKGFDIQSAEIIDEFRIVDRHNVTRSYNRGEEQFDKLNGHRITGRY